jgi:hypothetical protein
MEIKLGQKITVDRGSLGSWCGKIVELHPYGWAMGIDCYGVIETELGDLHSFDTFCHKLIPSPSKQ